MLKRSSYVLEVNVLTSSISIFCQISINKEKTLANLVEIIEVIWEYEKAYFEFETQENIYIDDYHNNYQDFIKSQKEFILEEKKFQMKNYCDPAETSLEEVFSKTDEIDLTYNLEIKNEMIVKLIKEIKNDEELLSMSEFFIPDQLGRELFDLAFDKRLSENNELDEIKKEVEEYCQEFSLETKKEQFKEIIGTMNKKIVKNVNNE